ncbi:MAG: universal stress protein [Bdellovibrionales bacterium]
MRGTNKTEFVVGIDLLDEAAEGEVRRTALANLAKYLSSASHAQIHLCFSANDLGGGQSNTNSRTSIRHLNRLIEMSVNHGWLFSVCHENFVEKMLDIENNAESEIEAYVLAIREQSWVNRFYHQSTAEDLMAKSERPVLLLGPKTAERWKDKSPRGEKINLLVATDLGESSITVEARALKFAQLSGAKITLLHNVWHEYRNFEESIMTVGMTPLIFEDTFRAMESQASEALHLGVEKIRAQGVECEGVLDTELRSIFQSLSAWESSHTIIVLGFRRMTSFADLLIGSCLSDTVIHSELPVLAIKF